MITPFSYRAGLVCLITAAALTAGCSSSGERPDRPENPFRTTPTPGDPRAPLSESELRLEADKAYRLAHDSMVTGDYETAITRFGQVISRYPFSDYATQSELEKIYAQYRSFQPDEAVIAADRFLREHPRHPNADYVQYLKGLTDFDRDKGVSDYLPLDTSKRDVTNSRRAYDDFALLLQKYPTSRYVGDARERMLYLRNRIASHELSVASYYVRRGAWVAAAKRAESVIAEYPGAPATADALLMLKDCYTKLGQKDQADEVSRLIAANAASLAAAQAPAPKPAEHSVVAAAADAAPPAGAAAAPAPKPRKGVWGSIVDFFDGGLDKTYTIGNADTNPPPAASGSAAARGEPDFAAPASLSTGPYSGPDTVITIPASDDKPAAPAAPAAAPAAAGTPGSTPDAPAATPKAAAAAPAPAQAPAATTAGTKAEEPTKEKSGGLFDFLNKTYTIGGPSKKAEAATPDSTQTAPATAPAAAPAAAPANAPAPADAKSGSGIRVYLDYDDEEAKKKAADDAEKAKAAAPADPAK